MANLHRKRLKACPHCGQLCAYSLTTCPNRACGKDCRKNAKVLANIHAKGTNGHANGNGHSEQTFQVEDVRQVKELTDRLGSSVVVRLCELLK